LGGKTNAGWKAGVPATGLSNTMFVMCLLGSQQDNLPVARLSKTVRSFLVTGLSGLPVKIYSFSSTLILLIDRFIVP